MAKFVHVTADQTKSGMRRFEELAAQDPASAEELEQVEADAEKVRKQRDQEYADRHREEEPGDL